MGDIKNPTPSAKGRKTNKSLRRGLKEQKILQEGREGHKDEFLEKEQNTLNHLRPFIFAAFL